MEEENNVEPLVHCIYTSAASFELTQEDILVILEKARENNAKLGVTGMLLYDSGSFFQVLEGKPETVRALLKVIQKDDRHGNVIRVIYEEIEERDFGEWTMGFAGLSRAELSDIEGLNDFFRSNKSYVDLDEGRAKMLLKAFKAGQWHAAIN